MKQSKGLTIAGWVLTVLPALLLLFSAQMKLRATPEVVQGFTGFGFPEAALRPIGVVEVVVTILFLIPQTSIFGGVLVAAYLGGATVTHVRVGQPFILPIIAGVLAWLGLWLRTPRLRELAPFVKRG